MLQKFNPAHSLNAEIILKNAETGEVLQHIQAESFVINFINKLYTENGLTLANCTDTGGVLRTMATSANFIRANGTAGDTSIGIVIGSGSTAVALTDTQLETLIASGITAGTLAYSGTTFMSPVLDGSDYLFEVTRLFSNSSGASVTVNEIGIYFVDGGGVFKFMMDRTLVSQPVTNGTTLAVTYRIKVTV